MLAPSVSPMAIRVATIDSSRIGSQLLATALQRDGFQVVYSGASSKEVLEVLARKQADIALVSAVLEGKAGRGYELVSQLRHSSPTVHAVMLLESSESDAVVKAFRAGARGVFSRDSALDTLRKCVTRVYEGQIWANNTEVQHLLEALVAPPRLRLVNASGAEILAPREQEVVHHVSEGLTNREIAERMGLSQNTIKNYIFRIFDKLGISKRVELTLYAATQLSSGAVAPTPVPAPSFTFGDDTALFRWCAENVEHFSLLPYLLAEMYRDGRGVEPDKENALTWFTIAQHLSADFGARCREQVRDLELRLGPKEVAVAKQRAADWLCRQGSGQPERNELRRAG